MKFRENQKSWKSLNSKIKNSENWKIKIEIKFENQKSWKSENPENRIKSKIVKIKLNLNHENP